MVMALASMAQKVNIRGKVAQGVEQVRLLAFDDKSLGYEEVEQKKVSNGQYAFSLNLDAPNLLKLEAGDKMARLSISEDSDITVDFTGDQAEIKGSNESLSMLSFDQQNGELQGKHFGALKEEADKAMASGDKEAMAEIQKKSVLAIQNFLGEFRQLLIEMGETPAGYYAIQFSDFNKELEFISQRLSAFEAKIPNSPVTKALTRQVYRAKVVAIGMAPPQFSAPDREGKIFEPGQYKGKILLIDFWAAWCRACRIENPQFVELYQEFNDRGLEIVSISQDRDQATWEKAIKKDGVGIWRQVQDKDESISELYSVSSLPQNVVLGKDGKILAKNVNAEQLRELLSTHL